MKLLIYAPDIHKFDAVGEHCISLFKLFKSNGVNVSIFSKNSNYDCGDIEVLHRDNMKNHCSEQSVIIFAYSIYDSFLDEIIRFDGKKICYFHNITDPLVVKDLDPKTKDLCKKGFEQLGRLTDVDYIVCNSKFTLSLVEKFNKQVSVSPPLGPDFLSELDGVGIRPINDKVKLVYIGRVSPHKNLECLIDILVTLRVNYKMNASLEIYGDTINQEYFEKIINLAYEKGIINDVAFFGKVRRQFITDAIDCSDFIVTSSLHEGFCLPMLEAMYAHRIPLTISGTAAEEVVGDERLVFSGAERAADIIYTLSHNNDLRISIIFELKKRAKRIISNTSSQFWDSILERI